MIAKVNKSEPHSEEEIQHGKVRKEMKVVDKTERCLKILDHASTCKNRKCASLPCQRMKFIIRHSNECPRRKECAACRQLVALCFQHTSQCKEADCKVVYCQYLNSIFSESLQNAS